MARTAGQPVSSERARRRRDELLSAARDVFAERGYANTTVSDIVRSSGGSRASFYSYFTSADDVLRALVRELADDLFEASTRPLTRDGTPFETLTASIRQFMHAYRDRAPMLAVLDQATVTSSEFRDIRLEIRARFAGAIADALGQRARHRGRVLGGTGDHDELDPTVLAVALGGMVEDMARGSYLLGQAIDEEQAVHTLAVVWARAIGLPTPP